MAYLHADRAPGSRVYLFIEGKKKPVAITVLGPSPDRPGQTRLSFDNVGGDTGITVRREEDVHISSIDNSR